MRKETTPLCIMSAVLALLALITISIFPVQVKASDEYPVEIIGTYSRDANELPEGIAVDSTGAVYVSVAQGDIWRQPADGSAPVVVTSFKDEIQLEDHNHPLARPLGMIFDEDDNLYVCLRSYDPYSQGVYRVNTEDGTHERLHGTDAIFHPNALAFDTRGNLYVTDTVIGAIWRIKPDKQDLNAELWFMHPFLKGINHPAIPVHNHHIGANGIAYWKRGFYVANTEKAHIVYVPLKSNGRPGIPRIVVAAGELFSMDGIVLDSDGNIYACVIGQHKVVRIDPHDGSVTTLATSEDGLDFPASPAFGRTEGDKSLYVVNYSAWPLLEGGIGPGVLKISVGAEGLYPPKRRIYGVGGGEFSK